MPRPINRVRPGKAKATAPLDNLAVRVTAAAGKTLRTPDWLARIRQLGAEPGDAAGAAFTAFMQIETRKWAEVIRASGATASD